MTTSAIIHISGTVPLIVQCLITQLSPTTYTVKEISNSRDGYQVMLSTDTSGAYSGSSFAPGEDIVITDISQQDVSLQGIKTLIFTKPPSLVMITCKSKE